MTSGGCVERRVPPEQLSTSPSYVLVPGLWRWRSPTMTEHNGTPGQQWPSRVEPGSSEPTRDAAAGEPYGEEMQGETEMTNRIGRRRSQGGAGREMSGRTVTFGAPARGQDGSQGAGGAPGQAPDGG